MRAIAAFISLVMIFTATSSCGEDCLKNYQLKGQVTDDNSNPLKEVAIRWNNEDATVLGRTNSDGTYSIDYRTRAFLEGTQIEFVRTGFVPQAAGLYSAAEADEDKCGDITLTRNVTLTPL